MKARFAPVIRAESIHELELELKSGRPDALFALAIELAGSVPLWPSDRSKAERGARLAKDIAAAPVKARMPELDSAMPPAEAWRVIAIQLLHQFVANLPGIAADQDAEYLHQARVALRRFRSAYALFKHGLPLPQTLLAELKKLNAALGPARDWDVFCMETLPPIFAAVPNRPLLQHLAELAAQARGHAHEHLAHYLQSPACGRVLLGLARRLSMPARHFVAELGTTQLRGFAARQLKKRHRQVITLAKNPNMSVEERHHLRISVKRLRYVLDCFASLYPRGPVASMGKTLADLQDALGHMNDQAVAHRLIRGIDDRSTSFALAEAAVHGWLAAIGAESERRLAGRLRTLSVTKRFW